MSMHGQLALPISSLRDDAPDRGAWAIIAFCAVGLFLTLLLAAHDPSLFAVQYGAF